MVKGIKTLTYPGLKDKSVSLKFNVFMSPPTRRVGGYIVLGADPIGIPVGVGVYVGFFVSVHYLLNQLMDFAQTCIDTLL